MLGEEAERPRSVLSYAQLAKAQQAAGHHDAAMQSYVIATLLQSAVLTPLDSTLYFQVGLAFHHAGSQRDAEDAFLSAVLLHPALAEAYSNLGTCRTGAAAIAPQRRAVQIAPQCADFHTNLAHSLLSAGSFMEGFREWSWRTKSPQRNFASPVWQGQHFAGQTLLIHAEQGYGDSLQFCRYIPDVARLGGKIIVESRAPMAGLLGRIDGVTITHPWGVDPPPHDLNVPLPNLAQFFADSFGDTPYLTSAAAYDDKWRAIFGSLPRRAGARIGVVWSGNPRGPDPRRALPYAALTKLAQSHPEAQFLGVQREVPDNPDEDGAITHLGPWIEDFDDLAAAMTQLDLVISVDTAAAHLAGALGRPVWVLLHSDADWRWWGLTPTTTEWYRSARLYRQARAGDWASVLAAVSADLPGLSADYSSRWVRSSRS